MSKLGSVTVTCSQCASPQKTSIYQSVNVTLDPSLKAAVGSRDLMRFLCDKCGHKSILNFPFLYHDMDLKLAIWYLPDGADEATKQAMGEFSRVLEATYRLRIVYDYYQLLETIDIFDSGISDWFVQMLKIRLAEKYAKGADITWYFEGIRRDERNVDTFTFVSPQLNDRCTMSSIPNARPTSRKFDAIEENLEWVHVNHANLEKVISAFNDRL